MSKAPILEARGISKRFMYPQEVEVLKDIDLTVYPGETIAIVGASGEGKSTLLHILSTLEKASGGTLIIDGQKVTSRRAPQIRNQTLGFIFQNFFLLEEETALDNVLMPARIGRLPLNKAYALDLLDQVGLKNRASFPAKLLSGGEKQRVCIARALCNNPPLIFADEPSGSLDHKTSESIHHLLIDKLKGEGRALIAVTHDPSLAALCDRTLTLQSGQLL
ncbi:MAG: ABC transporter ATP-binding protein [Verrucomicrobia bacterium]|nr:ABC transporter ATP-binding protein [Verrucomicrobiota bacterium]